MKEPMGYYGIISDPVIGWVPMARVMVARGVRWIQLRMKAGEPAERLAVARAVRAVITGPSVYIVNDEPELAKLAGADGVHLGQDDGPVAHARAILGPRALIGLSTHSVQQVRDGCALSPSYLGMGPVFPTDTKADAEPCIGLDGLAAMAAVSTLPAVAIGGIRLAQASAVMGAGVQGLCAVGGVNRSAQPAVDIAALQRVVGVVGP